MKIKLLTTCSTPDLHKCEKLEISLKKHGWDYEIIQHTWKGFGDKLLETYSYLKRHPDITHFFYTDAWDTIVTKTMADTLLKIKDFDKILLSAERGCYPHPEKATLYPDSGSPFNYVNGGGWFCNASIFCALIETYPLTPEVVDQVWLTDLFLNNPDTVQLDTTCEVFQTIAFCPEDNFKIHGRYWGVPTDNVVRNTLTNTYPTFLHGNGHTPMTRFYEQCL